MILFFIIFLTVQSAVNFYIGYRGFQALEFLPIAKPFFVALIVFMTIAYPLAMVLEQKMYNVFTAVLHWAGGFWFAFMLYVTLILFLIDIFRVVNHFYPMINFLPENIIKVKQWTFIAVTLISSAIVLGGYINAYIPKVVNLEIALDKKSEDQKELNIVALSDLHLGVIVRDGKMKNLVKKINELKPDIVLLAGDIIDSDPKPVEKLDLGKYFKNLDIPMGIYAITGNHEYIGDAERSISYLSNNKIKFLRDTAVNIDNLFYVIGREDIQRSRVEKEERKSLEQLLENVDMEKPIILLDHQPYNLGDVAKYPIDLQVSGHTHHGQMWPLSFFTKRIFEVSTGYKKNENTHFYVSSGYGTWGPPIKIGNRSEILSIRLKFKQ